MPCRVLDDPVRRKSFKYVHGVCKILLSTSERKASPPYRKTPPKEHPTSLPLPLTHPKKTPSKNPKTSAHASAPKIAEKNRRLGGLGVIKPPLAAPNGAERTNRLWGEAGNEVVGVVVWWGGVSAADTVLVEREGTVRAGRLGEPVLVENGRVGVLDFFQFNNFLL